MCTSHFLSLIHYPVTSFSACFLCLPHSSYSLLTVQFSYSYSLFIVPLSYSLLFPSIHHPPFTSYLSFTYHIHCLFPLSTTYLLSLFHYLLTLFTASFLYFTSTLTLLTIHLSSSLSVFFLSLYHLLLSINRYLVILSIAYSIFTNLSHIHHIPYLFIPIFPARHPHPPIPYSSSIFVIHCLFPLFSSLLLLIYGLRTRN